MFNLVSKDPAAYFGTSQIPSCRLIDLTLQVCVTILLENSNCYDESPITEALLFLAHLISFVPEVQRVQVVPKVLQIGMKTRREKPNSPAVRDCLICLISISLTADLELTIVFLRQHNYMDYFSLWQQMYPKMSTYRIFRASCLAICSLARASLSGLSEVTVSFYQMGISLNSLLHQLVETAPILAVERQRMDKGLPDCFYDELSIDGMSGSLEQDDEEEEMDSEIKKKSASELMKGFGDSRRSGFDRKAYNTVNSVEDLLIRGDCWSKMDEMDLIYKTFTDLASKQILCNLLSEEAQVSFARTYTEYSKQRTNSTQK